jgi:hypothetical protein
MSQLYIDDHGDLHSETELRYRLGTNRSGDDLTGILVPKLGFIKLSRQGRSVHVQFSRQVVSQKALAGLMYWCYDHDHQPLVLSFHDEPTVPQLVTKPSQLFTIVAGIVDAQSARPLYVEQPIDLERSAFSTRWQAARDTVLAHGRSQTARAHLDALFGGHWTLSAYDAVRDTFCFTDIGQWYFNFDPKLAVKLAGKATTAFRDRAYGRKVQRSFSELKNTQAPRAQLVDAVIKWGDKPARAYTYSRLLLPLAAPGAGSVALSATIIH